jgi:hypothetical protein
MAPLASYLAQAAFPDGTTRPTVLGMRRSATRTAANANGAAYADTRRRTPPRGWDGRSRGYFGSRSKTDFDQK